MITSRPVLLKQEKSHLRRCGGHDVCAMASETHLDDLARVGVVFDVEDGQPVEERHAAPRTSGSRAGAAATAGVRPRFLA